MRRVLTLLLSLGLSASVFAADEKHQVTFGNDLGFGWVNSSTKSDVSSNLFDDYNVTVGNYSLNYAYRIWENLQVGMSLGSQSETTKLKAINGSSIRNERKQSQFYLFATYNFSEDLTNAFYLTAAYGKTAYESTLKDSTGGPLETSKNEYDVTGYVFQLGKRFSLKAAGIENLTYSPAVTVKYGDVSGNLNEDYGVDTNTALQLDVVKFDLLF